MRSFPFRYHGQLLKITVRRVDEGWELWILDGERRLGYGGRVTVDEAIEAWRRGEDCVQVLAEEVKSQVLTGRLVLDPEDAAAPRAGPAKPQASRLPPIRRPQIFGIAAVLAAFILVEFVLGEHSKAPVALTAIASALGASRVHRYIPYNSRHDCRCER